MVRDRVRARRISNPSRDSLVIEPDFAQAFFNIMLRRFGVQGVKVHEVVSLDDEILNELPSVLRELLLW